MDSNTVLWVESFSEEEQTVKQNSPSDLNFHFREEPFQEVPASQVPPDTVLTIRTHSRLNPDQLEKVRCVISRSTGYDHLQSATLGNLNIPIGYLPDYATRAVAEHNLTVSLALLKQLNRSTRSTRDFERSGLTGREIPDRRIGIVGVGRIGRATAEMFSNLGCEELRGHDRAPREDWARSVGLQYVSLEELFRDSDLVILCLPLTDDTRGMISEHLLNSLPAQSFLVNSGRGEVVSLRDLHRTLQAGSLAGIALDVYNREDQLATFLRGNQDQAPDAEIQAGVDLIQDERVIATPHNAFNTDSALKRKVQQTLENIQCFRENGRLLDPVP